MARPWAGTSDRCCPRGAPWFGPAAGPGGVPGLAPTVQATGSVQLPGEALALAVSDLPKTRAICPGPAAGPPPAGMLVGDLGPCRGGPPGGPMN